MCNNDGGDIKLDQDKFINITSTNNTKILCALITLLELIKLVSIIIQ